MKDKFQPTSAFVGIPVVFCSRNKSDFCQLRRKKSFVLHSFPPKFVFIIVFISRTMKKHDIFFLNKSEKIKISLPLQHVYYQDFMEDATVLNLGDKSIKK